MIINQDGGPIVPDNTLIFFPLIPDEGFEAFNLKDINLFLNPLKNNHKRDWFGKHFYKCLPLSIGNSQGFVFSLPYTISVLWNGGNRPEDITISYFEDFEPYKKINFAHPTSEFGNGILTLHFPVSLKTPPGVNLMTIAPPNFPTPGLSPMTGVVEADNLRFTFTVNVKIDFPNTIITITPNYPLAGLLPIPRYFCDSFELKSAYDVFDKQSIEEEVDVVDKHGKIRKTSNNTVSKPDRTYFSGKDILGNIFKDHQIPKKNKS
jgi:hypothetical protein